MLFSRILYLLTINATEKHWEVDPKCIACNGKYKLDSYKYIESATKINSKYFHVYFYRPPGVTLKRYSACKQYSSIARNKNRVLYEITNFMGFQA